MEGAAFIGLRRPRLTWPEASLCGVHIFSQSFHESEIVFLRVFSRCHTCEPPFLQEWRRCEQQKNRICMYHDNGLAFNAEG